VDVTGSVGLYAADEAGDSSAGPPRRSGTLDLAGRDEVHQLFESVARNAQLAAEADDREPLPPPGRQVLPGLLICHRSADAQEGGCLDDRQKGSGIRLGLDHEVHLTVDKDNVEVDCITAYRVNGYTYFGRTATEGDGRAQTTADTPRAGTPDAR
jgi:hypothetical protein